MVKDFEQTSEQIPVEENNGQASETFEEGRECRACHEQKPLREFESRNSGRLVKTCRDCQPAATSAESSVGRVSKRKPSSKSRENNELEEELHGGRAAKKAKTDAARKSKEASNRSIALLDSVYSM